MSWTMRTGLRLLLWVASVLLRNAVTDMERSDLQFIITDIANESRHRSESSDSIGRVDSARGS
jgi:hypothetical protein